MPDIDTPAERAYVAARVQQMDQQLADMRATLMDGLDRYRDDMQADAAERNRQHEATLQRIQNEHQAWLDRWLAGDEPDPTDVDRQGQSGASAPVPAPAPGPGPVGQPNPHEAELIEADRLRHMDMATYSRERQQLIRANPGLFG